MINLIVNAMVNKELSFRLGNSWLGLTVVQSRLVRGLLLCSLLWCSFFGYAAQAEAKPLKTAVLYPQVRAPYNKIFNSILSGIEKQYTGKVVAYQLDKNSNTQDLLEQLNSDDIQAVITLGSHALNYVTQLKQHYPVVVGALNIASTTSNLSGISMLPSPQLLLEHLSTIQSEIRNVHIVCQADKQDWWVKLAQQASTQYQLNLVVHKVTNLAESAQTYRQLLAGLEPKNEALWLASSNSIMDNAIMKNILEFAWQHSLVVFSNKLSDVKRGALFAMYPDNQAMGGSLARLLMTHTQLSKTKAEIQLLSDVKVAINIRTAKHLSLHLSKSELQHYELIYPLR